MEINKVEDSENQEKLDYEKIIIGGKFKQSHKPINIKFKDVLGSLEIKSSFSVGSDNDVDKFPEFVKGEYKIYLTNFGLIAIHVKYPYTKNEIRLLPWQESGVIRVENSTFAIMDSSARDLYYDLSTKFWDNYWKNDADAVFITKKDLIRSSDTYHKIKDKYTNSFAVLSTTYVGKGLFNYYTYGDHAFFLSNIYTSKIIIDNKGKVRKFR